MPKYAAGEPSDLPEDRQHAPVLLPQDVVEFDLPSIPVGAHYQ